MTPVSDIKLIRTDTTLDLSQKAEKGMPIHRSPKLFIPSRRTNNLWEPPYSVTNTPDRARISKV